jgi:hypothetical protein
VVPDLSDNPSDIAHVIPHPRKLGNSVGRRRVGGSGNGRRLVVNCIDPLAALVAWVLTLPGADGTY